ncbi:hypothetical protein FNF29_01288 [Cafeteria roenbergensis]|uniref:Guanylate cyclase domain-containing protein n=1 Tax=Cafeteria roenbergensis TaxID=33653 RepID=A0A5A8CT39_CAFRO|nr:hypothetical protein FNF29_01288 [Cafeteria roenbergensis]|eukprot:KAA0155869.1 hypothetical protein FNF29_01288 [Cafeteria roenbergensis]
MLEILDGRQFGTLITLITIYALFGDDMRLWLTSKPSDNIFYGLSAVAFAFFAFEFMTNSCFRPGFASPPSFYFWLDLLATLSLLPEIGWIWDPVQSYLEGSGTTTSADLSAQIRAGRAARAGSKAGRVVRIVRLIRLVRVFKLYKHCRRARHLRQAQRDADAQDVSEHAGLITDEAPRFSVVEQSPFGAKSKDSPVVVGGSHRSARVAPERVNSGELPHVPSMRRAKLLVGAGQGATGQPAVLTPKHSASGAAPKAEGGPESKAVAPLSGVHPLPSDETFAAGPTNAPSGSRWSARSMGSADAASSFAAPPRLEPAVVRPFAAPTALDAAIAAQSEDPDELDSGAEVTGKQVHTISNVGIVLSDLTIRRVILLILVMLFVVPFLSTLDVSPSKQILGGLAQLHRYPQDANITDDEFRFNAQMYARHAGRVIYLAVCPESSTGCRHSRKVSVLHDWLSEMSFDENGDQPRFANGTAASRPYGLLTHPVTGWMPSMLLDSEATILTLYRNVEVQSFTTSGCFGLDSEGRTADDPARGPCESVVWLDDSVLTRYEAFLSFVRTWFVMAVISIGAALFTRDAELLVIRPIERMTALMTKLAADPLAEIQALTRDVFRDAYDSDEDGEFEDEDDEDLEEDEDEDELQDHTERAGGSREGHASPGKAARQSGVSRAITDSHSVDVVDLPGADPALARGGRRPDVGVAALTPRREGAGGGRPLTSTGASAASRRGGLSLGVPHLSMEGVRADRAGGRLRSESSSARDRRRSASARHSAREGSVSVEDHAAERHLRRGNRGSHRRLGQRALSAGRTGPQISKFASRRLILADANPVAITQARRSVHGTPAAGSVGLGDATAQASRSRAASSGRVKRKSLGAAAGRAALSKGSGAATADRAGRSGQSRRSLDDVSDDDTADAGDQAVGRRRGRRGVRFREKEAKPKSAADVAADCAAGTGRYVCASLVNLLGGSAEDASKRAQGSYETAQLENAMIKIGGLLQVGFGEAGADIIAQNMGQGQGKLNPLVPGKRVDAIFGFCDIRRFTDATECLQEDVMVFVNTVGQLVHSATHRLGGAANKNIGDAFLLTWKLPRLLNPAEIASKGKELLRQIQGTMKRGRRVSIDEFVDAMAQSGDAAVALSKLGTAAATGDKDPAAWESRHPSGMYGDGMASQGRWVHDQFTSTTRVPFGSRGLGTTTSLALVSPRTPSQGGTATEASPGASKPGEQAAAAAGSGGAGAGYRPSLLASEQGAMILEDEDEGATAPLGGHEAAAAASSAESPPLQRRMPSTSAGRRAAAEAWAGATAGSLAAPGNPDGAAADGRGLPDRGPGSPAHDLTARSPRIAPPGTAGAGPGLPGVADGSAVDSEAVTESLASSAPQAVPGAATANSIVARSTDHYAQASVGTSGRAGESGRASAASSGGASSTHPAAEVAPPVRVLPKPSGGVATPAGVQVVGRSAARRAAASPPTGGTAGAAAGGLTAAAAAAAGDGDDDDDANDGDVTSGAGKPDAGPSRSVSVGGGEDRRSAAAGDVISVLRPSLLASADGIPKHSMSERVGGVGDVSGGAVGRRLSMPSSFRPRMTRQSIIEPSARKDLQHGAGITILEDPAAPGGFLPDAAAAGGSRKPALAIRDRDATARTADNALAAFLKVIVDIHNANKRGGVLYPFLRHRAIRRRFGKSFRVELGFGLHLGWAVEGAVGSAYKVDASYLSPHVNLAARLEALTKYYGVPLLISGNFARELSLDAQRYLRLIDRITVKGSKVPIELYTFDITSYPPEFGQLRVNTMPRSAADRQPSFLLHETAIHVDFATDPSVLQLQADIPDAFFVSFHAAVRAYIRGDWLDAREQLVETEVRYRGAGKDGPTQALLKTMDRLGVGPDKEAPADWKQVHVLDSKTG